MVASRDANKPRKPADARAERLAAALKANLQRRKAQARERATLGGPDAPAEAAERVTEDTPEGKRG